MKRHLHNPEIVYLRKEGLAAASERAGPPPTRRRIVDSAAEALADVKRGSGPTGLIERLRELRKASDMALREQDRLAGLTPGHSQAIDAGRSSKGMEAQIVARLARVYGTTMDWLFMGIGSPPTEERREEALDRADQICRQEEEYRAKLRKL